MAVADVSLPGSEPLDVICRFHGRSKPEFSCERPAIRDVWQNLKNVNRIPSLLGNPVSLLNRLPECNTADRPAPAPAGSLPVVRRRELAPVNQSQRPLAESITGAG